MVIRVTSSFFGLFLETFWMGFELLSLPYELVPAYGGAVGFSPSHDTVCGALVHSDDKGLVWINGGLALDKGSSADEIYDFEYYSTDDLRASIGTWTWDGPCWRSAVPESQVKKLSVEEKLKIDAFIAIYRDVRNDKMIAN
jgi:hypothetical protein